MSYFRKWMTLGAAIGVAAGLGAVLFNLTLRWVNDLLLGGVTGHDPLAPAGTGHPPRLEYFTRPWAVPLVVGVGGLLSGVLVSRFAPEAAGHGTDAAIRAFHRHPSGIPLRVVLVKILASACTIGSGGSGGREGPTVQISAGVASSLARTLGLDRHDARIAVAVGVGSGVGAIFQAPLGGAVLGAELLYRHDMEARALFPSFIASSVGFVTFGLLEGFEPVFRVKEVAALQEPGQLVLYACIGVLAGLLGIAYSTAFYGMIRLWAALPVPRALKPAFAGALVGALGLLVPAALSTGDGWLQLAMGPELLSIPLWMVLAVPLVKILATSLSIGSGGSGGIFGPGIVIGGFLGAGVWRLSTDLLPGVPADPAPFVIVGMAACFGSIAHAPLAVILMVTEMTLSLSFLTPAMVAVGLAGFVVGDTTIYRSQLHSRQFLLHPP